MAWSPNVEILEQVDDCRIFGSNLERSRGRRKSAGDNYLGDVKCREANVVRSIPSCQTANSHRSLCRTFKSSQRWRLRTVYHGAFLNPEVSGSAPTAREQTSSIFKVLQPGVERSRLAKLWGSAAVCLSHCRTVSTVPTRLMHQPQSSPHLCIPAQ